MSSAGRLLLILGGINVMWGPVNLAVATAQDTMSTAAVVVTRWCLLACLIWIGLASPKVRSILNVTFPDVRGRWQAIGIGFALFAPSHMLYYTALKTTSTGEATVLQTSGPLWVAVLAGLILKEVVSPRRWGAIALGAFGSYVVTMGFALPSLESKHSVGNMIYLIGVVVESLSMILAIRIIKKSSGPGTLAFQFIGAAIACLIAPFLFPTVMPLQFGVPQPATFVALGYLIFVAGLFCFGVWYVFAEKAPISLMVISLGLQAPVAVALGWAFRGEVVSTSLFAGSAMILGALLLAARDQTTPLQPEIMQS